jgi:hypothetical protein
MFIRQNGEYFLSFLGNPAHEKVVCHITFSLSCILAPDRDF